MQRRDVLKQLSALAALGSLGLPAGAQGGGFEVVNPPQPTDIKGKVEVLYWRQIVLLLEYMFLRIMLSPKSRAMSSCDPVC